MKVLVTGGAGFIGSHLVEWLTGDGHSVTVLDDLSTGRNADLVKGSGAELIVGDVAHAATVRRALEGCQAVCHLAAVASVAASMERPLETLRANVVGAVTVFTEAAAMGPLPVVFASSAAVYGATQDLPLAESAPARPLSPYAADKLAGEHYLAHFHASGQLRGHAFRFFNVYGPRQDPRSPYSGVISVFLDRAAAGRPLVVHGDGGQTRDFVYVGDVVDVLARAVTGSGREHAAALPVTNIGRGTSVSILDLAKAAVASVGQRRSKIEFGAPRAGDVRHSLADVSLLKSRFGDSTPTDLAEGLAMTAGQ